MSDFEISEKEIEQLLSTAAAWPLVVHVQKPGNRGSFGGRYFGVFRLI